MRKKVAIIIGTVVVATLLFVAQPDFYIFINDTPDRVTGYVVGDSSPAKPIDVQPGQSKFINLSWIGANVLDATPCNRDIDPTYNFLILKVVKISKLKCYNPS